jgi:hypothetical protein
MARKNTRIRSKDLEASILMARLILENIDRANELHYEYKDREARDALEGILGDIKNLNFYVGKYSEKIDLKIKKEKRKKENKWLKLNRSKILKDNRIDI